MAATCLLARQRLQWPVQAALPAWTGRQLVVRAKLGPSRPAQIGQVPLDRLTRPASSDYHAHNQSSSGAARGAPGPARYSSAAPPPKADFVSSVLEVAGFSLIFGRAESSKRARPVAWTLIRLQPVGWTGTELEIDQNNRDASSATRSAAETWTSASLARIF